MNTILSFSETLKLDIQKNSLYHEDCDDQGYITQSLPPVVPDHDTLFMQPDFKAIDEGLFRQKNPPLEQNTSFPFFSTHPKHNDEDLSYIVKLYYLMQWTKIDKNNISYRGLEFLKRIFPKPFWLKINDNQYYSYEKIKIQSFPCRIPLKDYQNYLHPPDSTEHEKLTTLYKEKLYKEALWKNLRESEWNQKELHLPETMP